MLSGGGAGGGAVGMNAHCPARVDSVQVLTKLAFEPRTAGDVPAAAPGGALQENRAASNEHRPLMSAESRRASASAAHMASGANSGSFLTRRRSASASSVAREKRNGLILNLEFLAECTSDTGMRNLDCATTEALRWFRDERGFTDAELTLALEALWVVSVEATSNISGEKYLMTLVNPREVQRRLDEEPFDAYVRWHLDHIATRFSLAQLSSIVRGIRSRVINLAILPLHAYKPLSGDGAAETSSSPSQSVPSPVAEKDESVSAGTSSENIRSPKLGFFNSVSSYLNVMN